MVVFVAGAVAAREFAQRHQWTTPRLPGRCDAIAGWNGMDAMGWVGWDGLMSSIVYSFVKLPII